MAPAAPAVPPMPNAAAHALGRILAIPPGHPQYRDQVLRAFLEGSLLDTFGPQALDDPAFQQIVDQVQAGLRADGALAAAADRLVGRLLGGLQGGRTETELEAAFRRRSGPGQQSR